MAEPPDEARWIESEWLASASPAAVDEDDDEPAMTDLFADPDPMDTFDFTWRRSNEDDAPIAICLAGYKAELGQTLSSTGLTLWRASELLANFLVQHEARYLRAQRVLELGAGLGLCGILASHWEATQVVLTDGDTDALAGLRTNVTQNAATYRCPSVRTAQLVWGEGLDDFCATYGSTFDSILGADIIYVEEILQPLWATVDRLLSAEGVFLLAYARRNVSMDLVLAQATARDFVWETPADAEGVYLFRRRRQEEMEG